MILYDTTIYQINDSDINLKEILVSGVPFGRLVVLIKTTRDILKSDDEETLAKLINAVQFDAAKVPVYHIPEKEKLHLSAIYKSGKPDYILTFGLQPADLFMNVDSSQNKILHFNEMKLLFAPKLEELNSNKNMKTVLWKDLQVMFGIK